MGRSVQGIQAAQVRVFAHDAVSLVTGGGTLNTSTIANTDQRGVCLYIGEDMTLITVTMESGNSVTFKGLKAGSFLPVLVTAVTAATAKDGTLNDDAILALY
jgi:hypothetical protein|tara:strand:+ start:201 stop:506 length:306 start_codon:yes stop_codon:yes gene_type:complete